MDCPRDIEPLSRLLDGRLTPEEQGQVEEHLMDCPACRRAFIDMRSSQELLRGLKPLKLTGDLRRAVLDVPAPRRSVRWITTAVAAAVPILVAAAALLLMPAEADPALVRQKVSEHVALMGPVIRQISKFEGEEPVTEAELIALDVDTAQLEQRTQDLLKVVGSDPQLKSYTENCMSIVRQARELKYRRRENIAAGLAVLQTHIQNLRIQAVAARHNGIIVNAGTGRAVTISVSLPTDARLFALARVQFLNGKYGVAEAKFKQIVKDHKESRLVDDATYWLAVCNERQNRPDQAALLYYANSNPHWRDAKTLQKLLLTTRQCRNLYIGNRPARDVSEKALKQALQSRAQVLVAYKGGIATVAGDQHNRVIRALRVASRARLTGNTIVVSRVEFEKTLKKASETEY